MLFESKFRNEIFASYWQILESSFCSRLPIFANTLELPNSALATPAATAACRRSGRYRPGDIPAYLWETIQIERLLSQCARAAGLGCAICWQIEQMLPISFQKKSLIFRVRGFPALQKGMATKE